MPWVAAVIPAIASAAGAAGTTVAAAAPAIASAAGTVGSALASGAGAVGSALGSVGSAIGSGASALGSGALSALESAGSAIGSGVSSIGSGLGELGSSALEGISSFGGSTGGSEAALLESLGQTVPQGVELVGPSTELGADASIMFPNAVSSGMSAMPTSFGGGSPPSGSSAPSPPQKSGGGGGMLKSLLNPVPYEGGNKTFQKANEMFNPMNMLMGSQGGGGKDGPDPLPPPELPVLSAPQLLDTSRALNLIRAFQIQG